MRSLHHAVTLVALVATLPLTRAGAQQPAGKPEETEVWTPVPRIVDAGRGPATAMPRPADAIALFDGSGLSEWTNVEGKPAGWRVAGGIMTVNKQAGDVQTRRKFTNYQLHLEYRIPPGIKETGQARGNSGLFLANPSAGGYELQILDSYRNTTYVNGQAGSVYKQHPPMVNASRAPGEWQTYDVVWTAPTFGADGAMKTPAYVTALHNGVLVQDHFALTGETMYIGKPAYVAHGASPIKLQAHGDPSPPLSFRNIGVRELP
jgi:hypothetical protein